MFTSLNYRLPNPKHGLQGYIDAIDAAGLKTQRVTELTMGMVGLDQATIEANPPGAGVWITNIISSVIPLYVLAWLFTKLDVRSGFKGACVGLLIAFSFDFLARMTSNMFAQAPYELAWITGGFDMVLLTISGFILGAWLKIVDAN